MTRAEAANRANDIGKPDEKWTVFPRLRPRSPPHLLAAWIRAFVVASGNGTEPRALIAGTPAVLWAEIVDIVTNY